jgi:hypothetical protein
MVTVTVVCCLGGGQLRPVAGGLDGAKQLVRSGGVGVVVDGGLLGRVVDRGGDALEWSRRAG